MAKYFKILSIIFALGVFIIPKSLIFAQNTEMSCCSQKFEKKNCCSKEKQDQIPCEKNKKDDCNGNCTSCSTCSLSSIVFNLPKNIDQVKFQFLISLKNENFSYIPPSLSDIYSKIWQPPKIS